MFVYFDKGVRSVGNVVNYGALCHARSISQDKTIAMPVNQTPTKVTLSHPSGSSAEVLFFGATILSWKTKDGKVRINA